MYFSCVILGCLVFPKFSLLNGLYTKNTFLGLFINVKAPWGSDPGPLRPVCNEETLGLIQTLKQFLNLDQESK